jgi:hypothetical protein
MREVVRELTAGPNATIYWLAFISPLAVDDLMTQSSFPALLRAESLFFLQETMATIAATKKIFFRMYV